MIGAVSITPYCAALCGFCVASALELKDKQWGGKWDWIDWTLTVVGVAVGFSISSAISYLINQ